ncbi:MAG: NTP transferase domain-containing protein [Micropruina sp.]|uniref:nucleotidyltransferase family protein n=1 Tax=Micropruina sp. TaxID=2737536 RepID=UPI0039E2BA3C
MSATTGYARVGRPVAEPGPVPVILPGTKRRPMGVRSEGSARDRVVGLVLAAGAGTRAGGPKALRTTATGVPWLRGVVRRLLDGGCADVIVVLGAAADAARALVPAEASIVVCDRWQSGLSESLRTGLDAAARLHPDAVAAAITPVDIPDGSPATLRRLLIWLAPDCLVRASFAGRPGHPVLIGRRHWRPFADSLSGDSGGAWYLRAHGALSIECGDLESGRDLDT